MEAVVIRDIAALEAIRPAWEALLGRSSNDELAAGHRWVLPWWKVYGNGRELRCIAFYEDKQLVGFMPLVLRKHVYRPHIPFRRLELIGSGEEEADETASDYIGLVAEENKERAVVEAFVRTLDGALAGEWDEVVLTAMNGDQPTPELLRDAFKRRGQEVVLETIDSCPFVRLPETWDAYVASLKRKKRWQLRQVNKHFEEWAGHEPKLHRAKTEEEVAEATKVLHRLHAQRWGAPGVFGSAVFCRFHGLVMKELLPHDSLDLGWLEAKGEPVAAFYNFRWNGKEYHYQSGRKVGLPDNVRVGIVMKRGAHQAGDRGRNEGIRFPRGGVALQDGARADLSRARSLAGGAAVARGGRASRGGPRHRGRPQGARDARREASAAERALTVKYVVRSAPAAEVEDDVLALWKKLPEPPPEATFRWGWVDNPGRCFLLEADGAVVGVVGVGERHIALDGRTLKAGLLGGFVVEKSHRTFFPALMLQRAVLTWVKKNVDFAYGFPNESSAPIMKKLGFHDLVKLERWVLVVRHARYIERYVPSSRISRVIAAPIDRLRRFERRPPRGRKLEVAEPDSRFALAPFPSRPHGVRDDTFVRWRLANRPDQKCTVYRLTEGPRVIGYAAIHFDGSIAHVRDLQGIDVTAMSHVLRHLAGSLSDVQSISLLCSAPPELARALEDIGFVIRAPSRTLIGYAEDPELLPALSRWYATEADEDQ